MNTLFKQLKLVPSALGAAINLVKRVKPSRFLSKGLLFCLLVFFPIQLVAVLSSSQHAAAAETAIGLSHSVDPAQIKPLIVARALALAPGDTLTFYDVPNSKKLTSITIPNDPAKARPERKVEFIAPAMAILNRYFATAPPAGGENLTASSFFDAMGPTLMENGLGSVLLVGSPWFTAPGSLEKKEYIGAFPSDGLLLADRSKSPFGTQGKHDLVGVAIHYCFTTDGSSSFLNPEHKERVERAWSLLIAQRGGQLATFTDDLKTCFDRFADPKPSEEHHFAIDPKDATMQYMYRAQDVAPKIMNAQPVKTGDTAPPVSRDTRADAARFDRPQRTTPPSTRTGPFWAGLQWTDRIDLDLYVRCDPTAPFLFFGNQHDYEGHHNGDFRSGTGREFESVDITSSCQDVTKAQIFVNFYEGSVRTSPKGVFAIEFDGGLYKADFEVPAHEGNRGAGGNEAGTMGGPNWVKIQLSSVLHLNGNVAAARPRSRSTK